MTDRGKVLLALAGCVLAVLYLLGQAALGSAGGGGGGGDGQEEGLVPSGR